MILLDGNGHHGWVTLVKWGLLSIHTRLAVRRTERRLALIPSLNRSWRLDFFRLSHGWACIFSDLSGGYRPLAVNPLVLDCVLVFELHDLLHGGERLVGHEAEPSRLACAFVLQYGAVFDVTVLNKVRLEFFIRQVVRQAADEYLAILRVLHALLDRHGPRLLSRALRGFDLPGGLMALVPLILLRLDTNVAVGLRKLVLLSLRSLFLIYDRRYGFETIASMGELA